MTARMRASLDPLSPLLRVMRSSSLLRPHHLMVLACVMAGVLGGCRPAPPPPPDDPVSRGERLFFEETFAGNGRTCGTCHRAEENFTLTPAFIATLPASDALFVGETNPDLRENFENPRLMREFGVILENLDGFGDLPNRFVMRGIPHTLAQRTSVASAAGPRTGWSGDGAPGDGSLRSFAVGAVIQHFTKTLNRIPDVDFRLPTDAELDDLEAFMLSLGRQDELTLPLPLKGTVPARGQEIFLDGTLGKCNACHFNAGANADPSIFGAGAGNLSFNTGVEDLPDKPAVLTGERVPTDDGFGSPGSGEFNTPPIIEAADTGPFFHNNAIETIEGAVGFYDGESFNNSPAGQLLLAATGSGIELDGTQIVAIAAFLRVLNTLENIRQSLAYLEEGRTAHPDRADRQIRLAGEETADAIMVLTAGGLHPAAVMRLREAASAISAAAVRRGRPARIDEAVRALEAARAELVTT
jgi:mono/diheme cytochrome c family protein